MDRNFVSAFDDLAFSASLSARRAWIEISICTTLGCLLVVALRKESVDRNSVLVVGCPQGCWSLSARRAWIEIVDEVLTNEEQTVALRKESVDRNIRRCSIWVLQS